MKTTRAAAAFDGEGARLYGGRWNRPGTRVVYTSQSQSLAALELLVHLQASQLLVAYCLIPAELKDALVEEVETTALPSDWRRHPAPLALQELGDQWAAEQRSAVLQVPSAIVPAECNYVLNPGHPDFSQVTIGTAAPFDFDIRLK